VTNSLRAAARANGSTAADPDETQQPTYMMPLPDIEYTGAITDAEQVPVWVALARVMADVQSIGKNDQRNDVGGRYAFRGVDRVVNAVGPALRRHGVLALPTRVFDVERRETRTKSGTVMEDCTLLVEWTIFGPAGDSLPVPLVSAGQANDTSDKATAKAISVAQRVLWLTALQVPTQDPTIEQSHDRGERPTPKANDYRDEVVDPRTSAGRLLTIKGEVNRYNLGNVVVQNDNGDDEKLIDLINRTGRERSAGGQA
jgi:hypothetical protein